MSGEDEDVDYLDALLEQALDDFQENELNAKAQAVQQNKDEDDEAAVTVANKDFENTEKLQELLSNMNDPTFGRTLTSTMKDLSGTDAGRETVDDMFKNIAGQFEIDNKVNFAATDLKDEEVIQGTDRQVAAAMQMLGQAQKGMAGLNVGKMEETGESMMDDMMAQFEALGEKEDYNVCTYLKCMKLC